MDFCDGRIDEDVDGCGIIAAQGALQNRVIERVAETGRFPNLFSHLDSMFLSRWVISDYYDLDFGQSEPQR